MIPLYDAGGGGGTWLGRVWPWSPVGAGHVWSKSGEMCVVITGVLSCYHHGDTFHFPPEVPWSENLVPVFVNIGPGRLILVWHRDHEPLMLVSAWTLYKVLQCSQHIISFMAHGQTGRGIIVCCKASNLTSCFVSQLHSLARHLIDQPNAELSHCHRACWRKTWMEPDLPTNSP